jgi:recombination protein RecT
MASNELQKRDDARAVIEKPVLAILRKNKSVIEAIAKGVLTEDRVFRLINAAITRTPALLECSPFSVLNAIVHATYLGLEIAPEQAYLIPFANRAEGGKKVCTLVVDFRGKIRVAANADIVFDDPEIVYANDKFRRWTDENGKHFLHEPLESGDRGAPVGAYSVARWQGIAKITYMTAAEIGEIKTAALKRNNQTGPWKDHELRMWAKTTVHRAFKTLPRPTNPEHAAKLLRSQEIDDRNDLSEALDPVITGDFEDEQPFLPAGSTEKQEEVLERKLADAKDPGKNAALKHEGADHVATGEPPSFTSAENRKLDAELASQQEAENARIAAANQPKPTPKVRFGPQRQG